MSDVLILKKKDFKSWPFSVDMIFIEKKDYALYIITEKIKYNLNGVAKEGEPLEKIWLDNPEIPGTKISISPIMRKCKEVFN